MSSSTIQPSIQRELKLTIQSLLTSEMASGRLDGVKYVARSRENAFGSAYYPFIGISITHWTEKITATRQRQSTVDWAITLITRSTVSLEDAYDQLDQYLDDGQGNGLLAVLRDPNNYSLGGLVTKGEVTEAVYFDSAMTDKTQADSEWLAVGVIYYSTLQVLIQNG